MSNQHFATQRIQHTPLPRLVLIAARAAEYAYVTSKPRPKCSRGDFLAGFTAALMWANVTYAMEPEAEAA
jgi:hypothetical protein